MTSREIVVENIRAIRLSRGMTHAQVAEESNLPRTYIVGLEKGGINFTVDSIEQVAIALNVQTSIFFIEGSLRQKRKLRVSAK